MRVNESNSPPVVVSIVVPALNEEANLGALYERVTTVFQGLGADYDFELVITDNHSSDDTFGVARSLADRDPRVRVYRFAKNFGYQRSIYTAYLLAHGDVAVQLDADLQDPPELIPKMLSLWSEQAAMVVYGVRKKREGDTRALSLIRRVFYRFVNWLSEDELPYDAGDFRLIDRAVIEILRSSQDATPYIRGAVAASGFHQMGIEYERDRRVAGESKFNWGSMVRLAADGIMNHSVKPLQFASVSAMVISAVAAISIISYALGRLAFGQDWPAGFASLALLQMIGILLNAVFLGIIGAYVGRMYKQLKPGPFVIIQTSTDPQMDETILSAQPGLRHHRLRTTEDRLMPDDVREEAE